VKIGGELQRDRGSIGVQIKVVGGVAEQKCEVEESFVEGEG